MSEGTLENRKEKLFNFFKLKVEWLQYVVLAVIVWAGWIIRVQPINKLIDVTTGKYISLELDSTLFLRYAEYIAEHGKLFLIDSLRYFPRGANIDITIFSSYFVGYIYRILHALGFSGSVALVNDYYPLIVTAIMSIFLFLLIRKMFEWKTAALTVLLINVLPSFLFRSMGGSSDHDILGMMFLVMAFYFYLLALEAKKIKFNILFGFIAGVIAVLGLMTAGSINFFFMTASVFILIEIVLNRLTKNDFVVLTSFLLTFTLLLIGMNRNSLTGLIASFTTGLFYLDFIVGLFYLYIIKTSKFSKLLEKYNKLKNIPIGLLSLLFGLISSFFLTLILFGSGFLSERIAAFSQTLFKSFSLTRWVLTVAENRQPYVQDWFGQYGTIIVYAFILGAILLFYDAIKNSKRAKYLTLSYTIFIFLYIFSRYSGSSILNGTSGLSHFLFFGSLITFSLFILIYYFYIYNKERDEFDALTKFDKKHILILVFSLVMILIATSAIRFLFEFTLPIVILASYFIVYIVEYLYHSKNKNLLFFASFVLAFFFVKETMKLSGIIEFLLFLLITGGVAYFVYSKKQLNYASYACIIIILLMLFSPFAFAKGVVTNYYQVSYDNAKFSGPGYNQQWQYAGKWVRENTPKEAVFAHWWDYGYWVQSGFERATVTDGGNFFGWWNYLMGRNVLTAQTDEESLGYLYAHNVTHLLMVSDEIGKYSAYSSIGSDAAGDRFSYIPTFSLDPNTIRKTRNETLYYFTGGFALDEDLNYNGKIIPRGGAGIAAVVVPTYEIENNGNKSTAFSQPRAILIYQGQQYELPMRCFYLDHLYTYSNYAYGGCLRIIPVIQNNQANNFAAGLFLSPTTSHSNLGRLYLLNEPSDYFKLIYDDTNLGVPLSIYNGNLIGPIRIWGVNYPKDFKLSKEDMDFYLQTSYPDQSLLNPI